MYIESLKIGSFGKLRDKEILLTRGINIIEGNNESGKTTLGEFIKYIFYGLSNKSVDGKLSERKRHISWETNDCSGSIVLEKDGKKYRIERTTFQNANSYKDSVKVIDLESLSEIKIASSPGDFFFGLPENVFVNTSYVRQCDGPFFNGETVGQAVENLLYSADENVNTDKAISKLENARKMLKHKKDDGGGLLNELLKEKEELSQKLEKAREAQKNILVDEVKIRETKDRIENNKKRQLYLGDVLKAFDAREELKIQERVRSYDKTIEKYSKSKKGLEEKSGFNGFFPDESYVRELERARTELYLAQKNCEENLKNSAETPKISVPPYRDVFAEINESGGKDSLFDNENRKIKIIGKLLTSCVITALCALVLCLGMVFFGEKFGVYASVGWIAVGCLLFGAVAGVTVALIKNGKNKKFLRSFGCDNQREFYDLLDDFDEYEKSEIFRIENADAEKRKNTVFEERRNKALHETQKLLEKRGITSEKNAEEIILKIDSMIPELNEMISLRNKIQIEIEKNTEARKAVACQIGDFSDGDLDKYGQFEIGQKELEAGRKEVRREYEFIISENDSLIQKANELESELKVLKALNDDPSMLEARLLKVEKEYSDCLEMYAAYRLASECLTNAGINLRNEFSPMISKSAGELMSELTKGKYSEIGVSENLKMTYSDERDFKVDTREMDNLSSGTQDIAYVSLRLSLIKLLSGKNSVSPVIFDEPFSRVDDERLERMLRLTDTFCEKVSQAILFTSQKRDALIMNGIGKYNKVTL